jgi:hypothetical protein
MGDVKVKAGFYGWIPDADLPEGRRAVRILDVTPDGVVLAALCGIPAAHYEIDPGLFTPDHAALWWDGHVPSPEEEKEAAGLRRSTTVQQSRNDRGGS